VEWHAGKRNERFIWRNDLFQPPDLVEQSPDGNGADPFSQRKRVLPGVDYIKGIETEVG